ncbi:hypothetical protein B9Z65_99 [Elsinoe australis]|uniref:Uncharacterized protein n=1 Tax=Elsinoe australis TaxID=40998 RepID=A0A2P7ZKF3_9PEZI|nr:hypothetical protein B9Z65_99 [Elsinoe australis]
MSSSSSNSGGAERTVSAGNEQDQGQTGVATSSPTSSATSSGISTGAVAGIGVGAGIGGAALIAAVAWFCLRSRRRAKAEALSLKHNSVSPSESASQHPLGPNSVLGGQSESARSFAGGGPPPPSSTVVSPLSVYPHMAQLPDMRYDKYSLNHPTAELDTERPIRELPGDSFGKHTKS